MEIAAIKSALSIGSVLTHYGLSADRNGMLSCPFHDDKTPSMQQYDATVYCFSTNCARHGKHIDAIDFIMYKEGCTKHKAIMKAKELVGHVTEMAPAKPRAVGELPETMDSLFARMESALNRSTRALKYLEDRGLGELTGVGYNPGTLYKGLRQCVVFGLRDSRGGVVSLYGRSVRDDQKGKHFYSSGRRGLYPGWPRDDNRRIVLTESVIDAATLLVHTDEQVLALYGTNGLTEDHLTALDDWVRAPAGANGSEEIVLFFDGDDAGRAAAAKWSETLRNRYPKTAISRVATPDGEDINSLVISHEAAILAHLIGEREVLFPSPEPSSDEVSSEEKKGADAGAVEGQKSNALDTTEPQLLNWTRENLRFTLLGGVALYPLDRLKVTLKMERTDTQSPLHRLR